MARTCPPRCWKRPRDPHSSPPHDPDLHFGLGVASTVETVTILWPSGVEQELKDLEVNQVFGGHGTIHGLRPPT